MVMACAGCFAPFSQDTAKPMDATGALSGGGQRLI